jgi:predicted nucleotidyltransferase
MVKPRNSGSLAFLLSSRVKAEMFRLLFGLEPARLHVRELERRSGLALGTVRQELRRLSSLDLVQASVDGNRTYYQADRQHPLFPEIHGLVLKTAGMAEVLRPALRDPDIRLAFVFGSMASRSEHAKSDVDLMVLGRVGLRRLTRLLAGMTEQLGREINPHVMSPEEFVRRRARQDHFVSNVLAAPRIFVIGDERELEAMGG